MSTLYPVILLGTDVSTLDSSSDTALRMRAYEAYHSTIHIVVSAHDEKNRSAVKLSDTTTVYPSKKRNKILVLCEMYRRARNLMREHNIRCVMSQDPFMLGLVAYLLTRNGRGVFSVGIFGTDTTNSLFRRESLKNRFYTRISRFVLPRATAIQTDGPETVDHLTEKYGSKVFFKPMIPANIDVLGAEGRPSSHDPFRILFVGRFVKQKNISLLLDVINAVCARKQNILFTIVGSGPEHEWFKNEIRERGLSDVCDIRGTVARDVLPTLFNTHHLFLLVSYYEGFPRVFMEAAASGMPIVTTRVGGVKDLVVNEEGGYVLPQGTSPEVFADRIMTLAQNHELLARFSAAIKEKWNTIYGGRTVLTYQQPIAEFLGARIRS